MSVGSGVAAARRVVVVGSGIAGLTAALHATEAGADVVVVTKGALSEGSTRYAQGGVAVVVSEGATKEGVAWEGATGEGVTGEGVTAKGDSIPSHLADTLTAGAGLADEDAAGVLVSEGPERILELVRRGVAFDHDPAGSLARGLEAAHSYPRILHAGGDATGAAIEAALVDAVRASEVTVIEHAFLADLAVRGGAVVGVELIVDGSPRVISADAVVLATGGAGQLYAHTTNPRVVTGDGIAAAMRAGAVVADLEFVQFHPTVLDVGGPHAPFLISEAVRGEGAVLVDDTGHRFAFDAHPDGELAPRDVVARAIARTMAAQGGRAPLLDATALGAAFLARRFPTIDHAVRDRGLDWARAPIPVTPAAHYLMGGVATDLDGRTSIPGLFAAGEAARTGAHGANRLASNSLLEGAVFGARAGRSAAAPRTGTGPRAGASTAHRPVLSASPVLDARPPLDARPIVDAFAVPPFSRRALQELMWAEAGVLRSAEGLERAASVLAAWRTAAVPTPARSVSAAPARSLAEHEDGNLLLVAQAVVDAARRRTSSVGAHFRTDADEPATSLPLVEIGAFETAHARALQVEGVAAC